MAKQYVQKFYPVVGVLEMFNETIIVLENLLPRYFKGATLLAQKAFIDAYKDEKESNKNHKKHVSNYVMEMVKRNMTYEIEFYRFCKDRLQEQYEDVMHEKGLGARSNSF